VRVLRRVKMVGSAVGGGEVAEGAMLKFTERRSLRSSS
jgi:hypothetical protein